MTKETFEQLLLEITNSRNTIHQGALNRENKLLLFRLVEEFVSFEEQDYFKTKKVLWVFFFFIDLIRVTGKNISEEVLVHHLFSVSKHEGFYLFRCSFACSEIEMESILVRLGKLNKFDRRSRFDQKSRIWRSGGLGEFTKNAELALTLLQIDQSIDHNSIQVFREKFTNDIYILNLFAKKMI